MSLREAQQRLQKTAVCRLGSLIDSLDKDDKSVFAEWVGDKKPAGWIARVLLSEGHQCGEKTVKRHLDGLCNCLEGSTYKGAYRVSA